MSEWMLPRSGCQQRFSLCQPALLQRRGLHLQAHRQSTRAATLLIKVACEAIVGKRPHVAIFAPTTTRPTAPAVRDYVHVEDVARAHVDALDYLRSAAAPQRCSTCGYSRGYSVREVLRERTAHRRSRLAIREEPPAPGERIRLQLEWTPQLDNLDAIVDSAPALGAQAAARALVGACAGHSVTAVATGLTASRSPLA